MEFTFSLYPLNFIDVIFGPLDDYSLAPVSRFALVWDIPIITPGGLAPAFTITKQVDMISINKFFVPNASNILEEKEDFSPDNFLFFYFFKQNSIQIWLKLKGNYPTLTRMFGGYEHVGNALHGLFRQLNWDIISLMYHNHGVASGRGNSDCSFLSGAIESMFTTSYHRDFDELCATRSDYRRMLEKLKEMSRSEWIFLFFFCCC